MHALVLEGINQNFKILNVPQPQLSTGELLVKVSAAAINRRDFWIWKGKYAGLKFPIILGSDCSGIVEKVHDNIDEHWLGCDVVVNPSINWGTDEAYQGSNFSILGLPENGTFAEFVKVPSKNVYKKPNHLSFLVSSALPLAGLTAYRALFTKAKARKTDKVLIVGVGGGAASFALQFALALGCEVYVSSSSDQKIQQALTLGAKGAVNYTHENWDTDLLKISGGIDVIIDSAVGENFEKHFTYCNSGARIVIFGGTAGNMPALNIRPLFWKQIQILGTTMGTNDEFEKMIKFVEAYQIHPIISSTVPFSDAGSAFAIMEQSSQFGKIVISLD